MDKNIVIVIYDFFLRLAGYYAEASNMIYM